MSRPIDWDRRNAIIEDAEFIARHGGDSHEAATRIGIRTGTLYDLLRKAGRHDINLRLAGNAPDPVALRRIS